MKYIIFFILLILFLPEVQAIHWISGVVNDAPNIEAKGFNIMIYHPGNKLDNVKDTIGNIPHAIEIETNNYYMLDCEMLGTACKVGDTISVEVPEQNGYYAEPVNVIVTGAGFDQAPDMTLTKLKGKAKIATEEEKVTEETTGSEEESEEKAGITGSIIEKEVEKTNKDISKEVLNETIDITNQTEVKEKPEETSKSKITGTAIKEIKEAKNWLLTIFFIIIIVIVVVILYYRRKNGKT